MQRSCSSLKRTKALLKLLKGQKKDQDHQNIFLQNNILREKVILLRFWLFSYFSNFSSSFLKNCFWLLYVESDFFSRILPYGSFFSPTQNDGLQLGLSQVSVHVRFYSLCWIAGSHTVHPTTEGLLHPTYIDTQRSKILPPKQLDYILLLLR